LGDDHEDEIMDYGFEDPMDREEASGSAQREFKEFEDEFLDADDDEDEDD